MGQPTWNNECLRAGRSGDRIFRAVQKDPEFYPTSFTKVIRLLPGEERSEPGAGHPSPSSVSFEWVGFITPPLLCARVSMSWGDPSVTCLLSPLLHESFYAFILMIRLQEAPKCIYHSTSPLTAEFCKCKTRILRLFPTHICQESWRVRDNWAEKKKQRWK